MKSVLPIAFGIIGFGAIIYIYMKQRDKDKKKKADNSPEKSIEQLEFKVENNLVPLIVGRNSVNLKSIEEKTKTIIKFRECDDENQICTISGNTSDVKNAKQLIDAEAKKQPIITDEILLPATSCGKIEGYGGSVLHEICQKSSTKVWVDPGVRKNQGENRRVLITGTKEQVKLAKELIEEKIKETPVEQSLNVDENGDRKSSSPFPSNSSITTTESPREIRLPSPEKLKNNDGQLEVYVSAVSSPSRFWVQICGPQSNELDFLVDAMGTYYNEKENQDLHTIREPYLGQIVAAINLADNKWYRAEIVAIQPNSNDLVLDVYFLDYGDQQFVGRKDILELRADFLSLRFQAVECFLANVQPTNTGSKFEEWDRKAIEKFESLVQVAQWKKMISKVVTYKERKSFVLQRQSNKRESSPIPGVELYEEDSDHNIALELVESGFAEMSDRFGDLTKSSVLNVVDDKVVRSKEATPEPKKAEVEEKIKEETEDSHEWPESDDFKQKIEEKSTENDDFEAQPSKSGQIKEQPSKSDQINEQPSAEQDSLMTKQQENQPVPLDNNNQVGFDPKKLSNGESRKSKAESSKAFGDTKPAKTKKKKQLTSADFLKAEQEHGMKKSKKSEDWNAMMEE